MLAALQIRVVCFLLCRTTPAHKPKAFQNEDPRHGSCATSPTERVDCFSLDKWEAVKQSLYGTLVVYSRNLKALPLTIRQAIAT